jgi:hypothetical protein
VTGFLAGLSASRFLGLVFLIGATWVVLAPSRGVWRAKALLLAGWIVLLLLTPCYHPYARLWLPIEAFGWVLMGGGYAVIGTRLGSAPDPARPRDGSRALPDPIVALGAVSLLAFLVRITPARLSHELPIGTLLLPTDSLRQACRAIAQDLPAGLRSLRVYARPPVTFYLAGRIPVFPQANLPSLGAGGAGSWALLDTAMVRGEGPGPPVLAGMDPGWQVVRSVPTELSLPTLLDIDPSAARTGQGETLAPLLLLHRVRRGEGP